MSFESDQSEISRQAHASWPTAPAPSWHENVEKRLKEIEDKRIQVSLGSENGWKLSKPYVDPDIAYLLALVKKQREALEEIKRRGWATEDYDTRKNLADVAADSLRFDPDQERHGGKGET